MVPELQQQGFVPSIGGGSVFSLADPTTTGESYELNMIIFTALEKKATHRFETYEYLNSMIHHVNWLCFRYAQFLVLLVAPSSDDNSQVPGPQSLHFFLFLFPWPRGGVTGRPALRPP